MTFGEKLKTIRTDMKLSQQDLANMLNTSKQVISRYELGQTTPKIGVAAKWCEILGVNLECMLNDSKDVYDVKKETAAQNFSPNKQELTEGERMLLDLFNQIPENKQQLAIEMIRAALKAKE